jgi:hypothetical protein
MVSVKHANPALLFRFEDTMYSIQFIQLTKDGPVDFSALGWRRRVSYWVFGGRACL